MSATLGNVLLLGAGGQLGKELTPVLRALGPVLAATRSGVLPDGTSCELADFENPAGVLALLDRLQPAWVVNAAAYTAVDRAEQEQGTAWQVNAETPGAIARWCAAAGTPLVHYSTDYVFDGQGTRPYLEDDVASPLGVYGASKLAGENAIRAAAGHHMIFRTAWVYASHSANFLQTMLRLGGERDHLRVVCDQIGSPTPARLIAEVTLKALQRADPPSGTWHLAAAGQTSWHGFAQAIFAEARAAGVLDSTPVVEAVPSSDYPTVAQRPAWSVLDTTKLKRDFGLALPAWQDGLRQVIAELAAARPSR